MVSSSPIKQLLIFLSLFFPTAAPTSEVEWSYDNVDEWGVDNPTCDGYQQSPVDLKSGSTFYRPLPPLRFENYDVPLKGPLTIVNNGHTAIIELPSTRNGQRAAITGGKLLDRYEAVGVHFHWGSPQDLGSEHMVEGERFDVEMHIVHKNVNYATVDDASQNKDGLAVLAIMFNRADNPDRYYPGLNKIFNKLPQIINYESKARINRPLSLGHLLGDVNRNEFYTYKGSLTAPPCFESVTWHVFPDALPIATSQIYKFFDLIDSHDELLLSNNRPVQALEGRKIVYPTKNFIADFPIYGPYKR